MKLTKEGEELLMRIMPGSTLCEWHHGEFTLRDGIVIDGSAADELYREGMIDLSWGDHLRVVFMLTEKAHKYTFIL